MDSILNSVKRVVSVEAEDDSFDVDLIMHINSTFFTLKQLGVGSDFAIEDSSALWSDYLGEDTSLNAVKTYIYLRVRTLFDPPATSFHLESMKKQIEELEWRLNAEREYNKTPVVVVVASPSDI